MSIDIDAIKAIGRNSAEHSAELLAMHFRRERSALMAYLRFPIHAVRLRSFERAAWVCKYEREEAR